jgi:hypothetical protein
MPFDEEFIDAFRVGLKVAFGAVKKGLSWMFVIMKHMLVQGPELIIMSLHLCWYKCQYSVRMYIQNLCWQKCARIDKCSRIYAGICTGI